MKPVKVDESALLAARGALIEKLSPRLELKGPPGNTFFVDEPFVRRFGPGLHRLSDAAIVSAALVVLIQHVERQPDGKSGLPMLDAPLD